MGCVQYTISGIPDNLDAELRASALRESKSLNQVLPEMRTAGLGASLRQPRNAELLALAGTWVEDPATEKALGEMRMEENSLNMLYCPRTDTAVSETAVYEEMWHEVF